MTEIFYYVATSKFDARCGDGWDDYLKWSGLTQLHEVVTLDGMLCSFALPTVNEASYWEHIVNEDHMLDFFTDLEFMLSKLDDPEAVNVLAVIREPADFDHENAAPDHFTFLGFDLMDQEQGNSALSNCGGFPDVFANSELNTVGLLDHYNRAREIRDALRTTHPEEHHADCNVWAIYRRL